MPEPGRPAESGGSTDGWLAAMATRAHAAATGSPPGPVQLNAPFRKPLFGREVAPAPLPPPVRLLAGAAQLDRPLTTALAAELDHPRGVILCGPAASIDGAALSEAVAALGRRLGWPVVADAASGARLPQAIRHADALARSGTLPRAEIVLRIGAPPTSDALGEWLRTCARVMLVDADGWYLDPAAHADTLIAAEPVHLCRSLADGPHRHGEIWQRRWRNLDELAGAAIARAIIDEGHDFGGGVARAVAAAMPPGSCLHVASSMAVRDLDSFAGPLSTAVSANRGLNGIDGTIATGLGVAFASGAPTAVLCGDLAFLHDVGGLLCACSAGASASTSLTIVVCNNDGGAIFETLPIARDLDRGAFERLFATPQGHDIGALCRAAGAGHELVAATAVGEALARRLGRPGVSVIEVALDRERERALRAQVWRHIRRTLQQHREDP